MDRRNFLKATAGVAALTGTAGLSAPALAQGAAARTLRFVPQANLANFDPIWGTQYVVRNAAALVWDTLYGFDDKLESKRQMVESEEVSSDGKVWTFRLRDGLLWHDGTKVTAADCVASLNRWAVRDGMGQMIRAIQEELVAVDDRTFRWRLKAPYPKMLLALGKNNTPMAFMMPERIARTDPFQQVTEFVGSGPMRFVRNEWVPGARAVFTRFEQYAPRNEPPSWLAGGKRMGVDRIEWIIMPDPATASAALMSLSTTITAAPSDANNRAAASPIPCAAPVTITTLPSTNPKRRGNAARIISLVSSPTSGIPRGVGSSGLGGLEGVSATNATVVLGGPSKVPSSPMERSVRMFR